MGACYNFFTLFCMYITFTYIFVKMNNFQKSLCIKIEQITKCLHFKLIIANATNATDAVYCFAARARVEFLVEMAAAMNARGSHISKMQML